MPCTDRTRSVPRRLAGHAAPHSPCPRRSSTRPDLTPPHRPRLPLPSTLTSHACLASRTQPRSAVTTTSLVTTSFRAMAARPTPPHRSPRSRDGPRVATETLPVPCQPSRCGTHLAQTSLPPPHPKPATDLAITGSPGPAISHQANQTVPPMPALRRPPKLAIRDQPCRVSPTSPAKQRLGVP